MCRSVVVFAALACEVKPLIQRWRLQKYPGHHPFTIYVDEYRAVVVTGMGKLAMASAVGYAMALLQGTHTPILLNIGIAGHACHDLGVLLLGNKIINVDSGKVFFPQMPFTTRLQTAVVATVNKPQAAYPDDFLYEMEAAAFYEVALKFSTAEFIHCLKIVSDNRLASYTDIDEAWVLASIASHVDELEAVIQVLQNCRSGAQSDWADDQLQCFLKQMHFTVSNAVRLKNLLQRWCLIKGRVTPTIEAANAKELLVLLEQALQAEEFYL
jgi:adenosylhomocysteine nucleosidase